MPGTSPGMTISFSLPALFNRADEILDLLGVRPKLLGELVEIGIGNRDEAGLVDLGDDLDADLPQLVLRLMFELDRFRGLGLVDLVGGGLHPALLLRRQTVPELVADPDQAVIGLVLGPRKHGA